MLYCAVLLMGEQRIRDSSRYIEPKVAKSCKRCIDRQDLRGSSGYSDEARQAEPTLSCQERPTSAALGTDVAMSGSKACAWTFSLPFPFLKEVIEAVDHLCNYFLLVA